jgi:DNA mismatch repair protein MutS
VERELQQSVAGTRSRFLKSLQTALGGRSPAGADLERAYATAFDEVSADASSDLPLDALARRWVRGQSDASLLESLLPKLGGPAALVERLTRALVESPPLDASKGGYIAEAYDPALDELRDAASNDRRAIAALEAKYRDATAIPSLKIRHNAVLGYHVEVSARHADKLMQPNSGFTHRQTLAGVVRFNSPELHEEASRVIEAGAHTVVQEPSEAAYPRMPALALALNGHAVRVLADIGLEITRVAAELADGAEV